MELARYGYLVIHGITEVRAIYLAAKIKRHYGRARAALTMIRRYEATGHF